MDTMFNDLYRFIGRQVELHLNYTEVGDRVGGTLQVDGGVFFIEHQTMTVRFNSSLVDHFEVGGNNITIYLKDDLVFNGKNYVRLEYDLMLKTATWFYGHEADHTERMEVE